MYITQRERERTAATNIGTRELCKARAREYNIKSAARAMSSRKSIYQYIYMYIHNNIAGRYLLAHDKSRRCVCIESVFFFEGRLSIYICVVL